MAKDQVFFTATDILCSHTKLAAGGLSALTEGLIGLIAVPLNTLPRRGAPGEQPLGDVAQAKFLTKRFKAMNTGTDHRSVAAAKELRFLQGSGAGSKLSLDSLHDATWSVLPFDSDRVFVVRAPPTLARSLLGPFTAHVLATLKAEPLLQKLRESDTFDLHTLEAAEAALTSIDDSTTDAAARAAAVLGAAVHNTAVAYCGTFKSAKGCSRRTQEDNTLAFVKEADAAVAVVKKLLGRPDLLLGNLAAELKKAKEEELPAFLEPAAAVPPPQSLINGSAGAMAAAVRTRASRAAKANDGTAKAEAGATAKADRGIAKAEGGGGAAKAGAKRPAGSEIETPKSKRSAASGEMASPPTERVAALAAAALSGDRSALQAIIGGASPLAPSTPASAEMQVQVSSLREQLEEKSTKLNLAELRIQEVILELGKVKGELSAATVDKQQLGQLQGELTVSRCLAL